MQLFFLEERKKAQWMTLLLNCTAFPHFFTSATTIMAVMAMTPIMDNTDPDFSVDA